MKVTFKGDGRKFEAESENIEDIYYLVQDGLIAMGYHKDTAKRFINELKEDEQ